MGAVADKMTMGMVSLRVLRFSHCQYHSTVSIIPLSVSFHGQYHSTVSIIPPAFHSSLSIHNASTRWRLYVTRKGVTKLDNVATLLVSVRTTCIYFETPYLVLYRLTNI